MRQNAILLCLLSLSFGCNTDGKIIMEEMPLTTCEVVQLIVGYILYFGVPILLYCYFNYFRTKHKNTKNDSFFG